MLWNQWWNLVCELRPACARTRTFLWMSLCLAGISTRKDLQGVTYTSSHSPDKQGNNRCGFIVGVGLTVQSAILYQGRIRPKNRAGSMDSKGNAEATELHPLGRASPAGEACAGTLDTDGGTVKCGFLFLCSSPDPA